MSVMKTMQTGTKYMNGNARYLWEFERTIIIAVMTGFAPSFPPVLHVVVVHHVDAINFFNYFI